MPLKKIYECVPCRFEYEYIDFGVSYQKAVPPCPMCGKALTYEEPVSTEDYVYQCFGGDGGCGIQFSVEHLTGKAPETFTCPMCGATAKKRLASFAIVHGKSMTKGASLDVAIGRNAEKKWERVIERKTARDKIRKETGTQALHASGRDEYRPIKGGTLQTVTVPEKSVNKDE